MAEPPDEHDAQFLAQQISQRTGEGTILCFVGTDPESGETDIRSASTGVPPGGLEMAAQAMLEFAATFLQSKGCDCDRCTRRLDRVMRAVAALAENDEKGTVQ